MQHSIGLTPDLHAYIMKHWVFESPTLSDLRQQTAQHPRQRMQIAPEEGQFLAFMVKLVRARTILEVGVFLGYSSIWMAQALPDDGRLIALDNNADYVQVAERFWREAGVRDKIDLRIGSAIETLESLERSEKPQTIDLAFIDADKDSYESYYESCLRLVRPGGVICIDNVLMNGDVIRENPTDGRTIAIQKFNKRIAGDNRIELAMVPCGDGMTVVLKR